MGKERLLTPDQITRLLRPYAGLALGATVVSSSDFPGVFREVGVRPRDPLRNEYRGHIVTQPTSTMVAFGVSYYDRDSRQTDEDMHALDLNNQTLRLYGPREWENFDPRYAGTHHSPKPFFDL